MYVCQKRERGLFWARFFLLFSIFLLAALCIFTVAALTDAKAISDGVVRLHILADSDGEAEQALKLQVRDAILEAYADEMATLSDVGEAKDYFSDRLSEIKTLAEQVVKENGARHSVTVDFCREYYPTRSYGDFDLPAGEYTSLRILIGSGKGKNWFCMVYPPLCTASSESDEALLAAGFSESQVRLLTENEEGYTLRFKVVEAVSECIRKIREARKR